MGFCSFNADTGRQHIDDTGTQHIDDKDTPGVH